LKRWTAVPVVLACFAFASTTSAAGLDPRYEPNEDWGALDFPAIACGASSEQTVLLGKKLKRIRVRTPVVGQAVTALDGPQVATITAIAVVREGGKSAVRFTATGAGQQCGETDASLPETVDYDIGYMRRLPEGRRHFHAWTPEGEPTVRITKRVRFDCQTSSIKNPREDAWRCATADPCFSSPTNPRQMLCVQTPWSRSGLLVISDEPDTSYLDDVPKGPWTLELPDRLRCTFLAGGTWARAKRRLNYGCWRMGRPGRAAGVLYGRPNRARTILKARTPDAPFQRTRVLVSWN
jgi:hypothetical protein